MSFKDRIVLVTGGVQGIGRAIGETFARDGAKLCIADVQETAGQAAANEIAALGGEAMFVKIDVTSTASVEAAVQQCLSRFGSIDVLVNNAGGGGHAQFVDTDEALWDSLIELNFKGPMRLCKAVLPHMMARGSGKIVNIASDSARIGGAGSSIYSSCKGAVISFTKSIALEAARHHINVNCVSPGPTETPLFEKLKSTEFGAKKLGKIDRFVPLGRTGLPQDIASAVRFLASDEASFITGQTLSVSGGLVMV